MILPYVSLCQPTIFAGPPAVWLRSLERNTPQKLEVIHCVRGVISPLLSNIYLHEVFDRWLAEVVQERMEGKVFAVRYADDLVIGFTRSEERRGGKEGRSRGSPY